MSPMGIDIPCSVLCLDIPVKTSQKKIVTRRNVLLEKKKRLVKLFSLKKTPELWELRRGDRQKRERGRKREIEIDRQSNDLVFLKVTRKFF